MLFTLENAPSPIFFIDGGITTVSPLFINSKFLSLDNSTPSTTSHEFTFIPSPSAAFCSILLVVFKQISPFIISIFSIYLLFTVPNTVSIPLVSSTDFVL